MNGIRPRSDSNTHDNQSAELLVTGDTSSLARNTLLEATITAENIGVVLDDWEALLVERSSMVSFGDCDTDSVGETLAKRAGGDFDAISVVVFRVARGL